jgi:hypothetical protein
MLFDHVIRTEQHGRRDREADGRRGLGVDDQFEHGRLLERQVRRLRPSQDLVYKRAALRGTAMAFGP